MLRRALASSALLVLAAAAARGAAREVPVVPAEAAGAPVSAAAAAATVLSAPGLGVPAAPGLSAAAPLAAPLAAPAALPAPAAAADGPLRYNPAVPPEAEVGRAPAEKNDALKQLRGSLKARGAYDAIMLADLLYYTDPLTGLPNRAYFVERGAEALAGKPEPTVALLDMNNFGVVNVGLAEAHGVTKGRDRADAVLAVAGAAMGELSHRHGVKVVRLGGEEFVVLGSKADVLSFTAEAKAMMPPEKLLAAAGIAAAERAAIARAAERVGRAGQPVGDFTYGVASALGRAPVDALKAADEALNAAKEVPGGRGSVRVASDDGGHAEWVPPARDGAAPELPPARPRPDTARSLTELESRLDAQERTFFREAAFRDPLTLARSYDYVGLQAAEWDRAYAGGGKASLLSARNLKQINDLLGHDAGDRYLRRLGVVIRRELVRARRAGLDVREPVRVASKEFLLVGRDADQAAERVRRAVAKDIEAGRMLSRDEVARLRREVRERGLVPAGRENYIGTLRVVDERLDDGAGRADSRGALDRAFERLEDAKRAEDAAGPR
ncbi:MAG: diguanylate cyclase [Elusimicrobia bacterium]|nr:diguanylate cyclase [Elusimicrobiota bacterium]